MNRRLLLPLMLLLAVLAAPFASHAYGPPITVMVNGQPVAFDQPPVMLGARVLVPLRGVFQQLGATVVYTAASRSIRAQQGERSIDLQIGSHTAMIGGQPSQLDTAPILVGGRALVPLRFLAQALNANVDWHPERNLVTVTSAGAPPVGGRPEHYGTEADIIRDIEPDSRGPLAPGQSLRIRMRAASGGVATFDIGRTRDVPMLEERRGEYTAVYTVRREDQDPAARVVGHLRLPNGQRGRREARFTVALGGGGLVPRPAAYLIANVIHNGTGPLFPGHLLEVTMTGAPGGQGTFGVGFIRNIPMREVSPGTYVGTYTIPAGPPNPAVQVTARLAMPDGRVQTRRGPNVNLVGGP